MRGVPKGENASLSRLAYLSVADERFARTYRLTNPAEFKFVFDSPCKVSDRDIAVLCRTNNLDRARLGITVPKRQVNGAVARNRIKRLVRESFRRHRADLSGLDIVVMVRHGFSKMTNKQILVNLDKHWQDLRRQCKN